MKWILVGLFFATAVANLGVDYSTRISADVAKCVVGKGYSYSIIRGFRSYGAVDPNIVANLKDAWAAGFKEVDVYMFPSPPKKNPREQVDKLVSALKSSKYGRIWIDIEVYNWNKDKKVNRQFILDLVDQFTKHNVNIAIYVSHRSWKAVVGLDWDALKKYNLWYAHYDHKKNFSDFHPYGGWTKPTIKQFQGTTHICGGGFDFNYREKQSMDTSL